MNTIPDANSMQPGTSWLWGGIAAYPYQTRAFLWDKHNGMQDLGTLPGGTDAEALLYQRVGTSGWILLHQFGAKSFLRRQLRFRINHGLVHLE